MGARLLAALMAVSLCGCEPLALNFRNEMREMDSKEGLALGYIQGNVLEILPLGGGPLANENLDNQSGPRESSSGWPSPDGKLIVWQISWPDSKPGDPSLIVQTITGARVAAWYGQLNTIAALALSPDKSRVALEVQNYFPGAPATGLQYVVLGTPNRVMIEGMPQQKEGDASDSLGWSPDSHRIVFSRQRKIIVLNIETGARNAIAEGMEPAWSPDGHWVSFTSTRGSAMLIDPSNRRTMTLYGGREITGPIAWSPDSCCVSFSDGHKGLVDAVLFSNAKMVVYRISDGAWFVLKRFGPNGGTSAHFGWLYNYREFLAHKNPASK
jgi:hypothetical protein